MHIRRFLLFPLLISLLGARPEELPRCGQTAFVPERSTTATAKIAENVFEKPGSLKHESTNMFDEINKKLSDEDQLQAACPAPCPAEGPRAIFRSVPKKLEADPSGTCEVLLARTKEDPIVFRKSFDSINQFSDWFTRLSQGEGDSGEQLYEECPGKCSPQYETVIDKQDQKIAAEVRVVCGLPRDKDDNRFQLSAGYLLRCEDRARG